MRRRTSGTSPVHGVRINPCGRYSAREAAAYLGVYRTTVYDYVKSESRPLPLARRPARGRMTFLGADLMRYKAEGLPERGRKRKDGRACAGKRGTRCRSESVRGKKKSVKGH